MNTALVTGGYSRRAHLAATDIPHEHASTGAIIGGEPSR